MSLFKKAKAKNIRKRVDAAADQAEADLAPVAAAQNLSLHAHDDDDAPVVRRAPAATRTLAHKKGFLLSASSAAVKSNTADLLASASLHDRADADSAFAAPSASAALTSAVIPDAADIIAARRKREFIRNHMSHPDDNSAEANEQGDDFIPLDEDVPRHLRQQCGDESDQDESRLIREDDEMGEGDGFEDDYNQDRLAFGQNAVKVLRRQQRLEMQQGIDEREDENGSESEDEEVLEWERQQIRKGTATRPTETHALEFALAPKPKEERIPSVVPIPVFSKMFDQLQLKLAAMKSEHASSVTDVERLRDQKESTTALIEQINVQIAAYGDKYTFFHEMRAWIDNFVELLDAKMPDLQRLEATFLRALYHSTHGAMARRAELFRDDVVAWTGGKLRSNEQSVDEFGRDTGVMLRLQCAQRQRQRKERRDTRRGNAYRNARERKQLPFDEEGMSTDDELDDGGDDAAAMESTHDQVRSLIDEAADEFRSLEAILSKFSKWRSEFYQDYCNAWTGLCLPGVLEIFVRQSLILAWNWSDKSAESYRELSVLDWHQHVAAYLEQQTSDEENGGDNELLGKTVEKYVIPFLARLVKGDPGMLDHLEKTDDADARHPAESMSALNPYSARQMHWLSQAVDNVTYYLNDDQLAAGAFRKLMDAIRDRFRAAIAHEVQGQSHLFSTIYERTAAQATDEHRFGAWRQCCYNTLGMYINMNAFLKRHRHHFGAASVDQLLQQINARSLIEAPLMLTIGIGIECLHAIPAFPEAVVELVERVVELAPESWYAQEWPAVKHLTAQLFSTATITNQALVERAIKVLIRVHAYDFAATLGKQHRLS